MRLLISPIRQMATMRGVAAKDGVGVNWDDLGVVENGALVIDDRRIVFAGPATEAPAPAPGDRRLDASELVALPGLIDPHTHPCWAGSRHAEFAMRAAGATYAEIARAGGGIRATVNATRRAEEDELAAGATTRLRRMLALGVTGVEAKSGYALETAGELRMLRAIRRAAAATGQTVFATFLGAHAVPPEFAGAVDRYVDLLVNEMLPAVAAEKLADFCDVFVEDGYFTATQGRRILTKAADLGMRLRVHADEFSPCGGARLAAELSATSADHLMAVDDAGIAALARAGVSAVLLPATTLFLGQTGYAPARRLLDGGVRVALATDLNPGSSYTENLQLVLTLACAQLKMSPAEALTGVTYNAARSLLAHDRLGALLPGYRADVALFAAPDLSAIPYHMAMNDLRYVVLGGEVYEASPPFARQGSGEIDPVDPVKRTHPFTKK
jgi:imidazolonepropionase